ncbi:deoxynucleoside kinase [Flavobacteriaceae bacterium]|nr:deoxynucleoside kinase [Flavobacteriaceae bacterium]
MKFIEGNVGSGKSTFLKLLQQKGHQIILEPVNEWCNLVNKNGNNLLQEFYGDQERYAYTFQSIAFRTRVNNLKNYNGELIERSIFTDRNVFAKTCYENGKMNDIEWSDYCSWFDWLSDTFNVKPTGFIYLRAEPEVSYERIKKRCRSGEETIPFEYLQELHNKHEKWLMDEPNVLVLNVNDDFENNPEKLNEMLEKVKKFVG